MTSNQDVTLALVGGKLRISVADDYLRHLWAPGHCDPADITARHEQIVNDRHGPEAWAEATEELLAETYHHVSRWVGEACAPGRAMRLLIASPELWALPIEAANRGDGTSLLERFDITRSPLQERSRCRATRTAAPSISVRTNLESLVPAGAIEASNVHRIYHRSVSGGAGRTKLNGPVVHVIGHGCRLGAGDAEAIPAGAHVVISSCRSLPRTLPGGARSVLGSLWPVDDVTNALFMLSYHQYLADGAAPIAALRRTRIDHRDLNPTTSAAYTLLGDPQ